MGEASDCQAFSVKTLLLNEQRANFRFSIDSEGQSWCLINGQMEKSSPFEFIRYVFSSGYIMSSVDLLHAYDAIFKEIYLAWKKSGKFDHLEVNRTIEIKGKTVKVIHAPDEHLNMVVEDHGTKHIVKVEDILK